MTRVEMIDALRKAAQLLEEHPEWPDHWTTSGIGGHHATKEQLVGFVRVLGTVKKRGEGESFWLDYKLAPEFELTLFAASREAVCRRIVTKVLKPAEPELVLPAKPEREEEVVTWDCEPLLARQEV